MSKTQRRVMFFKHFDPQQEVVSSLIAKAALPGCITLKKIKEVLLLNSSCGIILVPRSKKKQSEKNYKQIVTL